MLEIAAVGVGDVGIAGQAIEVDMGGYYGVEGCLVLEDVDLEVGFSDVGHVGGEVWGDQVKLGLNK